MNEPTIRQPTVFLPLMMSLVALSMVLVHFAIFGIVEETDEGTAAHIYQLLIVVQVPFIAFLLVEGSSPSGCTEEKYHLPLNKSPVFGWGFLFHIYSYLFK